MSDSNQTVLVVDDEINVGKALARTLFDYDVHIETSALSALKYLETSHNNVFLVISDFKMPGMDGIEFLKTVKIRYPDIIRILLSGFTEQLSVINIVNDLEIFRVIEKPFISEHLQQIVKSAQNHYKIMSYLKKLDIEHKKKSYNKVFELQTDEYDYDEYLSIFTDPAINKNFITKLLGLTNRLTENKSYSEYKEILSYASIFYKGVPSSFTGLASEQTISVDLPNTRDLLVFLEMSGLKTRISSGILQKIKTILDLHPEYFNGEGPNGLRAEKIPVEARLFAVIASYSYHMMSKTPDEVSQIIKWGVGHKFDPAIVKILFGNSL